MVQSRTLLCCTTRNARAPFRYAALSRKGALSRLRTVSQVCVLGGLLLAVQPKTAEAFEHRHALGAGYQFGYISAKSGGRYDLRSFPVSYIGRYGGDWAGAFRLSALVPLRASSGDQSFSPSDEYDSTQAYDAVTGLSRRFSEVYGFKIDALLGVHFHYVEWSSSAIGVAAGANARHPIGAGFWGGRPEVGVHLELAYDAIDLSHGGDLGSGIQGQAQVSVGWLMGEDR